jgi:hypothetical protein
VGQMFKCQKQSQHVANSQSQCAITLQQKCVPAFICLRYRFNTNIFNNCLCYIIWYTTQSNAFASFSPCLAFVRNPLQSQNKLFPFGSQDWKVFWSFNFFSWKTFHQFKQTAQHLTMHDLHGHDTFVLFSGSLNL